MKKIGRDQLVDQVHRTYYGLLESPMQNMTSSQSVKESVSCDAYEIKRQNKNLLREYELRIQFFTTGCIVHVGCESHAFDTVEKGMEEVTLYVNNPTQRKKYWENKENKEN